MVQVRRILHPTDFSENGKVVLPHVCEYVERHQAQLHVLHVLEPFLPATDFSWAGMDHAEIEARRESAAQEAMEAFLAALPVPRERMVGTVRRGKAHQVIADYAREFEIDLIIMATHGHTGLSHLLLGSTAELVVRTAPCPVLTVKIHPERADAEDVSA